MYKWQKIYKDKLRSSREIANEINSNYVCVSLPAASEPVGIINAIAERALQDNLEGVKHHILLPLRAEKIYTPELNGRFNVVSWFTSTLSRKTVQEGRADFLPSFYNQVPKLWEERLEPDVFYTTVSPMDKHGYFSFGLCLSEGLALKKRAKKIFLEVNENMPRVHGKEHIHISEVNAICENNLPLPELFNEEITENDKAIGNYIAELIPNEATIQLGIGGIPNAVAKALENKKDLGIHTELFTEGMLELIEKGVVTNRKKNLHVGKTVTTFALGSKRMYEYLDDNVGVEFHPVDYVNNPNIIGMHDNFISINSCLEVDLFGQVCSESIGTKNFSGTGGQVDFARGANLSKGGKSFITFPSTGKKGKVFSKIKPVLTEGAIVTTTRCDVDYLVTEYGIAQLKGKTVSQRAKELISIAHPDFREELTFAAKIMKII